MVIDNFPIFNNLWRISLLKQIYQGRKEILLMHCNDKTNQLHKN